MSDSSDSLRRWEPYAGVAYVVFFFASMAVSNPPADNASEPEVDRRATRATSEQIGHLATGFLLLLAGLALMTFLVALWRRIAAAHPAEPSRLPVAAAGAAAALMGAGGMVMAYISGGDSSATTRYPASTCCACPTTSASRSPASPDHGQPGPQSPHSASRATPPASSAKRMRAFGVLTAFALLLAMLFVPIGAYSSGYSWQP